MEPGRTKVTMDKGGHGHNSSHLIYYALIRANGQLKVTQVEEAKPS
jgi:hypothetical protein